MQLYGRHPAPGPTSYLFFLCSLALWSALLGCASPGAPRAPSLQLPRFPSDFTASRKGNDVELHFTVPSRTTENVLLHSREVHGALCRQTTLHGACQPITLPQAAVPLHIPSPGHPARPVLWTDPLPPDLSIGPVRPLFYRLQLSNAEGRSAGYSDPVSVAAGQAPPAVDTFTATGTRLGVLLAWTPQPGAGEVLIERQQLDPPPTTKSNTAQPTSAGRSFSGPPRAEDTPGILWLQAEPGNQAAARTLDNTAVEHVRYRYLAVRRLRTELSGRTYELRSAPSPAVEIAWTDTYPPPSPQRLTALGFQVPPTAGQAASAFAVDLIWEPVRDLRVIGYQLYRVPLTTTGGDAGPPLLLNPQPLTTPAFHDTTASPAQTYRYQVTAIDAKGNVSAPATTTLQGTGD